MLAVYTPPIVTASAPRSLRVHRKWVCSKMDSSRSRQRLLFDIIRCFWLRVLMVVVVVVVVVVAVVMVLVVVTVVVILMRKLVLIIMTTIAPFNRKKR